MLSKTIENRGRGNYKPRSWSLLKTLLQICETYKNRETNHFCSLWARIYTKVFFLFLDIFYFLQIIYSSFFKMQKKGSFNFVGFLLLSKGFWGQPLWYKFPVSLSNHVGFTPWLLSGNTLPTPQKDLSNWRLVELNLLDFSNRTRTGISILTSAAD